MLFAATILPIVFTNAEYGEYSFINNMKKPTLWYKMIVAYTTWNRLLYCNLRVGILAE